MALKSRSTRSGRRAAFGSGFVVRQGLPRRLAPWIPACPHQPLHAAAADLLAWRAQGDPGAPVAVGAVVALVDLLDPGEQALVLDRARAERRPLARS